MTSLHESTTAEQAEIEVTPEMVEAGLRVLLESGAIENPSPELERRLVERLIRAALLAGQTQP